jgi:hypothetical protein
MERIANATTATEEKIEITREMERAGFDVLDDWTGVLDKGTLAREVYTAMVRAKARPIVVRKRRARPVDAR